MLELVSEVVPELYKCCHLAYGRHSMLQFGNFSISLKEVSQQGNPPGGLFFCLVIHPFLRSAASPLMMGFMDDI